MGMLLALMRRRPDAARVKKPQLRPRIEPGREHESASKRGSEDLKEASVMLAAGGTGGHLFPAFALAEELGRRGIAVDLVTDMRGDRYGTGFPARKVYQVPSATLAGRSPLAAAKTAVTLARGVRAASKLLR